MQTAIDFARSAPPIRWLDLRVFAHNENARSLYTKLGFTELGVVVDRFQIDGVSMDDVLMTLDVSRSISR
jgi:RimJ/RimL family protein N-acetyltransferase